MALTEEEHDMLIKIHTVLLGTNGDDGLVGDVQRFSNSHYKLRRNFWMLVSFLTGSGVLGAGAIVSQLI